MLTCGCARVNGIWCPCALHLPSDDASIRAENVKLSAEVEKLREMWESERTAVKNITEIVGEVTKERDAALLQISEERSRCAVLAQDIVKAVDDRTTLPDYLREFIAAKLNEIREPQKPKRLCPQVTMEGFGCSGEDGHDGPHTVALKRKELPPKEEPTVWCTCVPEKDGTHQPDCVGESNA